MDSISLDDIPMLWRAESIAPLQRTYRTTGYAALDEALGGGWPIPSLIELMGDQQGIGELRLLVGLLQTDASPAAEPAYSTSGVLWLGPPFEPHSIALAQHGIDPQLHLLCPVSRPADLQWAMTQALRSGAFGTIIAWDRQLTSAALRAIKLAAVAGRSVGVLFRPMRAARTASPATVRVCLEITLTGSLKVSIVKAQGRRPAVVLLSFDDKDVSRDSVG